MGPETCNSKEMKHVIISNSIDYLETQVEKLRNLVYKINPGPACEETKSVDPPKNKPSLLEVLENSPNKINNLSDQIGDYVNQLRNILF